MVLWPPSLSQYKMWIRLAGLARMYYKNLCMKRFSFFVMTMYFFALFCLQFLCSFFDTWSDVKQSLHTVHSTKIFLPPTPHSLRVYFSQLHNWNDVLHVKEYSAASKLQAKKGSVLFFAANESIASHFSHHQASMELNGLSLRCCHCGCCRCLGSSRMMH